ncbi:MAG: hypothetical protein ACE1ZS_03500 [Candidatus Poribacteria bacterium]
MKNNRFQTVIPQTGIVHIPKYLLQDFVGHLTEIVLQEVDQKDKSSYIKSLRGKYRHALSSTEEFSRRKASEKALEL